MLIFRQSPIMATACRAVHAPAQEPARNERKERTHCQGATICDGLGPSSLPDLQSMWNESPSKKNDLYGPTAR